VNFLFLLIVIKCVDPGEVVNATYTITGQYPGDTRAYTCSAGSTQKGGDSVRTCQIDGTWDGKPIVCVASGKYLLSVRMDIDAIEHKRLSNLHLDSN
jgi:hypothetical protein